MPGSVTLAADRTVAQTNWQQTTIPLDRLGKQRPLRVRLVIQDQVTGVNS